MADTQNDLQGKLTKEATALHYLIQADVGLQKEGMQVLIFLQDPSQAKYQQPITQKSAGEESLKPQLCCNIYFCDSRDAWEHLALKIADFWH